MVTESSTVKNDKGDLIAIEEFKSLLRDGFENPLSIKGAIRILIPEVLNENFILIMNEILIFREDTKEIDVDAVLAIPLQVVRRICHEFEYIEWQDPEVIGLISINGDRSLVGLLFEFCQRPGKWLQSRFDYVDKMHEEQNARQLNSVMYLDNPSQVDILNAMNESRPVVVRGLRSDIEAASWTLQKVRDKFGHVPVLVTSVESKYTVDELLQEGNQHEHSLTESGVDECSGIYTNGTSLPSEMSDYFGPMFFSRSDYMPPQLWFGSMPLNMPCTSLRREPRDTFVIQILGRKRIEFYSADQKDFLYPRKTYNNYQRCWYKPDSPDYGVFPLASNANSISVILEPGELVLCPKGWFHEVYALESPNMSVNYSWWY